MYQRNLPLYILQILTIPLTKLIIIVSILYYLIIQIHTGNKYLEWSKICAWYVFSGRQTHIVHGRPRLRWPLFVIEFSYIHIIKKYHFLYSNPLFSRESIKMIKMVFKKRSCKLNYVCTARQSKHPLTLHEIAFRIVALIKSNV